jgi:hypothetical protein
MAEDLSAWVDYSPDGTPRVKPGLGALPPMNPAPRPARLTSGKATSGKADNGTADDPKRKAAAGRFGILNAFVDCSLAELSRSEIAVWLVLYRDTRDGTVRTSQENIAKRSGTSVRHVKKALASLTAAGLLTVVFQGGLNRGPSRFRVNPLGTRRS